MKKLAYLLLIIILIASISFSFFACQYKQTISEPGTFDRSKINILGTKSVKVGDMKWELLEAKDQGTQIANESGAALSPIKGKFIFVSFSIENTGTEALTLLDSKVIDDKGRIFSICNEAYGYIFGTSYSACTFARIIPNIGPRQFYAAFDVNLDSTGLVLQVTDLKVPPQEKAYIDLGL